MDDNIQSEFMLDMLLDIVVRSMKVCFLQQIRLTEKDQRGNAGLVEKSQSADIFFVQRGSGVD